LSPFGMATRPVLWDYASSLQVYPLPTAMVLADTEAPAFCVTYEGCHVMNPGSIVAPGRRGVAKWVEYNIRNKVGKVKEALF
jgi:DNA polymerase epsilon subunit 2